jgi:hypothetical protein
METPQIKKFKGIALKERRFQYPRFTDFDYNLKQRDFVITRDQIVLNVNYQKSELVIYDARKFIFQS